MTHLSDASTIKTNEWYHVAATYNGSKMQLFVNGELVGASTIQSGNVSFPSTGWLVMGAYKDNDESIVHKGQMDEVRLWQRQLSNSEIFNMVFQPEQEAIAYFPL